MSFKQQVCSIDSFYTTRFPPRNMKSSLVFHWVFHWVFWQAHINFSHFQQLNPIKINRKSIKYFSKVINLRSNCSSHCGEAIPYPVSEEMIYMKKERRSAYHTPTQDSQTPLDLFQLLSGDCSFCSVFLALQARQTATHSTRLWQMCNFLLYSLNSAWEACKKKKLTCLPYCRLPPCKT